MFRRKNPANKASPDELRRVADELRDRHEWSQATEAYRRYLSEAPSDGPLWVQLGNCLKEAGLFAESKAAYLRAQELMPMDADLHIQSGHLAKLTGRAREAIDFFWTGFQIDGSRVDARDEAYALLDELEIVGDGSSATPRLRLGPDAPVHPARDRFLNEKEAELDPDRVAHSAQALDRFAMILPKPHADDEPALIPRTLHFVFGFKQSGDIPYYGYIAIASALYHNPGWRAYYYTMHEPSGPNWSKIAEKVTVVQIDDFDYYGHVRLHHYAHKSDVIRMIILNMVGGVYLDIDTITRQSFEPLRQHDFVMGVQAASSNSAAGLCNAIMMGKPLAKFSTLWLTHYDYFRSRGRDDLWDYHSVKLPVRLMSENPKLVHVLDYRKLFYPLWHSLERALFSDAGAQYKADFETAICHHLWNGASGPWLERIDENFVRTSKSIYAELARQVEGLSERSATHGIEVAGVVTAVSPRLPIPPEADKAVSGMVGIKGGTQIPAERASVAKDAAS